MEQIRFTDENGSFSMKNPQRVSGLYFPIAADGGLKSSLTPLLGGDTKKDQNTFLLEPVSIENLHNNRSTRNFWCRFPEGAWSATGASAEQEAVRGSSAEDETELFAGFMWHTIRRTSGTYPLRAKLTSFIPVDCPDTEVLLITLRNIGAQPCRFTPVSAVPIYGRSADNLRDHRHVTSLLHRIRVTEYGVAVTPTLTFDERGHKKNTLTYYVFGEDGDGKPPVGMIPVTEDFLGEGGTFLHPEAVYGAAQGDGSRLCRGQVTPGAETAGFEAMGALVFADCELAAGEEKTYLLCMGIGEKKDVDALEQRMKQFREANWRNSLSETKRAWEEQVNIRFHTGDQRFDHFLRWVTFQPMLRRIYGCSFLPHHDYGKGGRGWRDLWQDCLALLLMNPTGVRQMLLDNFDGVRMDGSNATIIGSRPGEFLADRNRIVRVWMDHGFWPLHTTAFYLHQTGDVSLLLEEAGYFKDGQASRGEETDERWTEADGTVQRSRNGSPVTGTVLEHILIQNLTAFYDVGEHNRIRLRGADWNDALDMAQERGESVAFTYAYAGNLGTLCELLLWLEQQGIKELSLAEELLPLLSEDETLYSETDRKRELLRSYCRSVCHETTGQRREVSTKQLYRVLHRMEQWWKGTLGSEEWLAAKTEGEPGFFNGYYDNHGRRVENNEPECRRMMLTGQVFAILSGTATREQTKEIIRSADRYLYRESAGGYCLNTDFGEGKYDLGRMFGFAYGEKENGAVFSHMAVMYGNALYQRGFFRAGFRALDALYRQAADTEKSRIYPGIPEYFNSRGRGMYHYLTGAASWYLMTVLTRMFGIRGQFGDLCLSPALQPEQFDAQGRAEVRFRYLGRKLKVIYQKTKTAGSGRRELRIPREELLSWDAETEHEIVMEVESYEMEAD